VAIEDAKKAERAKGILHGWVRMILS